MELEKSLQTNKNILTLNKEHESILESVKKELELNKYNSIVTEDNCDSMKDSRKELNATIKFMDRFRIDKVKAETTDIKMFEDNCKIYKSLIEAKVESIDKGLIVFKEKEEALVQKLCKEYMLDFANNKAWLREEFVNKVDVSDMKLKGYISTTTETINKKGRDEVEKRVNAQLSLQNKVDLRLSNLENECLKADIAILSKEHVQGFLLDDDESYNIKLNALIEIEIKRATAEKKKIEEKAKVEAEKVAQEKVIADQKALKAELEARYQSKIRNATLSELTVINIELKSYDATATYELKQQAVQRQRDLEEQEKALENKPQEVNEESQAQHLRDIAKEEVKPTLKQSDESVTEKKDYIMGVDYASGNDETAYVNVKKPVNGKIERTLSIKIKVPESATKEQVINAVTKMIKEDKLSLDSFKMI